MRIVHPAIVTLNILVAACGRAEPPEAGAREPVVGLPCEGCEEVFEGLPLHVGTASRIAPPDEPGKPLRIEGTVRDASGRPVPGVVVYAYQTDSRGIYPERERLRHGRLRGWAKSDASGRYRFDTIRPASYPGSTIPAHVHMHVIEPGRCTYYIDDLTFDDDPHLTPAERSRFGGRGGGGLAVPRREGDVEAVTRDIVLGARIPGYPAAK